MTPAGDLHARMEAADAATLLQFTAGAEPDVANRLGQAARVDDGAVAGLVAAIDSLTLNRIVGLGCATPASEAQLDRLLAFARAAGARRVFVQVAPNAAPSALAAWVMARGGQPYNAWVRLSRGLDAPPDTAATSLRLAEIPRSHAPEFAAIVRASFGMPPVLDDWLAGSVGTPGWRHLGAWDGPVLAATGVLCVQGRTAWLGYDATGPEYRGRGAQGALIAERCRLAASLGCDLATAETAEPRPDTPVPSHRNYLRFGFRQDYRRQNYALTLGADANGPGA
ncbi:MAG: GNAT family N-acetyltransferase [Vicinamibacterales bacterium]